MDRRRFLAIAALAAVPALPTFAQQSKTLGGLVIELGLMPAEKAVHAAGHSDAHPGTFPSGSQHVLVVVAEEKTGRRIGTAQVDVEVVDPKGQATKKRLLRTSAAGVPDYSELFVFGWSGTYSVRVNVTGVEGAKPFKTVFTVHHRI